jgi:thiol:disulfide interchange protein
MPLRHRLAQAGVLFERYERPIWTAVLALVLWVQWPMVTGLYYRATGSPAPASTIAWRTDLDAALAEARTAGKPVFVDFTASWCPPCIAMQHDVWPDGRVAGLLHRDYVPLQVDVDRDAATAARYGVEGIPTLLVLDASGRVQRTGTYMSAGALVHWLGQTAALRR